MSFARKLIVALALVTSVLSLASLGANAATTYTVRGRVTYPDGRPAAGLQLMMYALDPGKGVDTANVVWKIPNLDHHLVTTDADGRYVMTNVVDYPENPTQWYTVRVTEESSHFWHGAVRFKLRPERPVTEADVSLEEASWVVLKLKDQNGKPFNGMRVIYFQVGKDLSTPTKGYQRFEEVTFVNGVAAIRVVIRDKNSPFTRIAILDVPHRAAAAYAMEAKGLEKNVKSGRDGFTLAHKDAKGRALDRQFDLAPLGEATVEFTL